MVCAGITLIRVHRLLVTLDEDFDHALNASKQMSVVWALGPLRPEDLTNPHMTPTNHGLPQGGNFGVAVLTLDREMDDCQSVLTPLVPDMGRVLVADRGTSLVVTTGEAMHYPNPPSSGKSLFVNRYEAPVLKVRSGQAGWGWVGWGGDGWGWQEPCHAVPCSVECLGFRV